MREKHFPSAADAGQILPRRDGAAGTEEDEMLVSVVATDGDKVAARHHTLRADAWISISVRCSTGEHRTATLMVSPAVARSLIDELRSAVAALEAEMAANAAQVADAAG